ncbi:hypothetical protein [Pseudomonas putida]|nr:hypothetical protein [Pseudomonas putida]
MKKSLGMYALIVVWNVLRVLFLILIFLPMAGVGFAADVCDFHQ